MPCDGMFQVPVQMFHFIDDIFPVLLKTLSDHSDEVIQQPIELSGFMESQFLLIFPESP